MNRAVIFNFANWKLDYRKDNLSVFIYSVSKTYNKMNLLADKLVVGNYYTILDDEKKYVKYVLKELPSAFQFTPSSVFELDGKRLIRSDIYKEVFELRDDRTDMLIINKIDSKLHFEMYIRPNGEISGIRTTD